MDDDSSFKLRVDKVFGSLSTSPSSMWSLTDEEIEKKEWNRDQNRIDDERVPCNSKGGFFEKEVTPAVGQQWFSDLQKFHHDDEEDVDDDVDEESASERRQKEHQIRRRESNGGDEDELDVRSSIGLDCTLDYEEEEDEFDKVAIGKEKAKSGDCLFMTDVTNYGIDDDDVDVLPQSFDVHVTKDPRANHMAAILRLKEDTDTAGDFHSLNLSDNKSQITTNIIIHDPPPLEEDASIPKPILKKRQTQTQTKTNMHPKSNKRVRFDPRFDNSVNTIQHDPPPKTKESSSNLPDYLRNPTKYTCYTLDDESNTGIDDESNHKAYMDFLKLVKNPTTTETDDTVDTSKPPAFISRKPNTPSVKKREDEGNVSQVKLPPGIHIVAGDEQDNESEANEMEEDEDEKPNEGVDKSVQKPGRQYRARQEFVD